MDNNLPLYPNRFEQFKDMLKTHLFEIILSSIYTFLFSLPTIFWIFFTALTSFFSESHILNVLIIILGITFTLPLSSLGFAGTFYVFRRLLFNEGTSINSDFFLGIKKNGKEFAKLFFIIGLIYSFLHISIFNISNMQVDANTMVILTGISYVVFFLFLFIICFACSQVVLYKDSLSKFIKNGILFTFGSLYKSIGIFIIIFLPFIIYEFIPINSLKWISIILSGFFYIGFSTLLFMIFSNHIFDKTINIKQFPEIYRKGLIKDENLSNNN